MYSISLVLFNSLGHQVEMQFLLYFGSQFRV